MQPLYFISCNGLRILFRCLGGLKAYGVENVPKKGGVIVAPNHISYLDPPAVGAGMPRQVHFMAKKELFRTPIQNWWMHAVGSFPVNRGSADRGAIKRAIEYLKSGEVLCIFPEGTRSPDGKLQQPELGLGMIALKARVPVIPVAVIDTDKALPPGGKMKKHPTKIIYGKPLDFSDLYEGKESREAIEEIGRRTMVAIAELQKQYS